MKQLTLIRHAKSSWKQAGLEDFERPLNQRGQQDAPRMGARLARAAAAPEAIVSSAARRAAETARLIAGQLGQDPAGVRFERELYLASASELLDRVQRFESSLSHVALVAHNPGITDFVNALADLRIDNVPTCGIVRLGLPRAEWRDVDPGCADLLDFDYPKRDRD